MNKKFLKRGIFIVVEGIDGSGKTLFAKNVADQLQNTYQVLLTKEPGGSMVGKQIRTLVQQQETPLNPQAEFLLFAADRAQHIQEVLEPALHKGMIVVCDRFCDSSLAYQGYGRGLDCTMIETVNNWVIKGIKPDLTFFLTIDAATAQARIHKRREQLTTFEQEDFTFMNRVAQGYQELYKNRHDIIRLSAWQTPEQLTKEAVTVIEQWTINNNLLH